MSLITQQYIQQQVKQALSEDVGSGDVTASLIPVEQQATAQIVAREQAILCGKQWLDEVFKQLDSSIKVEWKIDDKESILAGMIICTISGPARPILSGERVALNFIQTLSGTATTAHQYVEAVKGTSCRILDTRKTIPGLRLAQKYAVGCGGADNHRIGLYDAILIKENHISAAGSITTAITLAKKLYPDLLIEVEVENVDELREAIKAGAQRVLLDNMDTATLKQAVTINNGQLELEASGGITLQNIREVAKTGVDYISIGSITKHLKAIDLSMVFI